MSGGTRLPGVIGLHKGRVHDSLYVEGMQLTVIANDAVSTQFHLNGLHVLPPQMTPAQARRFAELLNAAADDVEASARAAA